jgi:hypothetical protein
MTGRMTEAGSQTKRIAPARRMRLELSSDPGELVDRIGTSRSPAAFALETRPRAVKRRACGQNAALQRRVVGLGKRVCNHS